MRFLPEALGASRAALLQVNPHTEEVARGLGAGAARVFARITAPQILPGMSAGALLVFLTVMKELPITLLLSPVGFDTLATQVWSASREAFFTQAALPALVLVALSGAAVLIILRRERHVTDDHGSLRVGAWRGARASATSSRSIGADLDVPQRLAPPCWGPAAAARPRSCA